MVGKPLVKDTLATLTAWFEFQSLDCELYQEITP